MVRFSLVGAYGYWNYGDDLLAWIFSEKIREWVPNSQILVSAPDNGADYTKKITKATEVLPITSLKFWMTHRMQNNRSDYIVFGGGGILYDYPHLTKHKLALDPRRASALFYLASLRSYSNNGLAIAHGIGIGPLKSKYSQLLTKYFLRKVDLLTVRDSESYQYVKNSQNAPMIIPDPSFILAKGLKVATNTKKEIGVVVRKWTGESIFNNESESKRLFDMIENVSGYKIVPISLRKGEFSHIGGRKVYEWDPLIISPLEFANELGKFSIIITMRLHAMNVAACYGVPSIPIGIDPKIVNSAKTLGLENYICKLESIEDDLIGKITDLLSNTEIKENLIRTTQQYSIEVEESFNIIKANFVNYN